MTVTVVLSDGAVDKYMRSGDAYVKHGDGTLDILRVGSREPHSYAAGAWADVHGDEKRHRMGRN